MVRNLQIELRDASPADLPMLLSLIRLLAEFEKLPVTATEESLHQALFGEALAAHALLAFVNGEPAGYATYFFTFASMSARRGLWLDDLFVVPSFRGKGIGRAIINHVANVAREHGCGRMEWIVLDWNENAIEFYRSLGATLQNEWRLCRLDASQLSIVADSGPPSART